MTAILEHMPDILGIQEGELTQINYLIDKLGQYYHYSGVPRDLRDGESVGIFTRKDTLLLHKA